MPIDYKRYPPNWMIGVYQVKIVLTVAHLDHDETNWDVKIDRLKALCQLCPLATRCCRKISKIIKQESMKIPHRQTTLSGCAYFCLANLLDDKRYIHDVEGLTRGQGSFVTNERLREYYPPWYIETIFCVSEELGMVLNDPRLFGIKWDQIPAEQKEFFAIPYLITIKRTQDKNHAILALQNMKDGWMYVFDSMKAERTESDLEAFVQGYRILQVESFHSFQIEEDLRDLPIAIDKRQFRHLFEEGE